MREPGDVSIAKARGIPRSTVAGWLRRPVRPVTAADDEAETAAALRRRIERLEGRLARLRAVLRVLFILFRILKPVLAGLTLRHDHGSQFLSRHYQAEIRFLGAKSSPSFVREPEGNGVVERSWRTLKEQLLWVKTFRTIEELRLALLEFRDFYNRYWILQKHGYLTPSQVRAKLAVGREVAA